MLVGIAMPGIVPDYVALYRKQLRERFSVAYRHLADDQAVIQALRLKGVIPHYDGQVMAPLAAGHGLVHMEGLF